MSEKLQTVAQLEDKCVDIRSNLLNFIHRIGMGHLGGELSIVEMAVALYYKYLNFDVLNPKQEGRDRFILSKAHCSETLYTIFSDQGAYTQDYMVEHFENLDQYKFGMHSNRRSRFRPVLWVTACRSRSAMRWARASARRIIACSS